MPVAGLRAVLALLTLAGALMPAVVTGQTVTAQVTGMVVDRDGGLVPGATVTITNPATGLQRNLLTGPDGAFAFVDLLAGTYDLSVALQGFKTSARKDILVEATERVNLPSIVLEVGDLQETITVRNEAPLVQTRTGARGTSITRDQIEDIPLKGRDVIGMLNLQPGVVDTNPREAPSWNLLSGLNINGGRPSGINLTYDGITNRESHGGNLAAPGLDSIAEVRLQSSNFQAEYGRSSGASITLITRSGSSAFRGSAAFYKRDAALNGNEYARVMQCRQGETGVCEPALYEFDNVAWTLGGPVLVPGTAFNSRRNRLFFFWSQDVLARTDPGVLNQRRMPTALERRGDFSETRDSLNRRVFIRDPQLPGTCNSVSGGPACFAGNIIPAHRIDATAQAFLDMFPLPNASDPTGRNLYNYAFQTVTDWPRNDQVLRLDWNVGAKTTVYGRVQVGNERRVGATNTFAFMGGWPQMDAKFETESIGYVSTLLHSFGSRTFLDVTAGVNRQDQDASAVSQAVLDANTRSKVLPGLPQFFPEANPLDLLPNAMFNGNAMPGTIGLFQYERRFPFYSYNTLWNLSANLTRVARSHNIKTGIFVEDLSRPGRQRSAFNGTINFSADGSNPLNTNVGFANALLGAITSYQKADVQPTGDNAFVNVEFYAQDNWRVNRTFTIDAGVRFYLLGSTRNRAGLVTQFDPEQFDPTAAPLLFEPVTTPQGRRAQNPLTGDILPAVYIGRLVPGSGDPVQGMRLYDGTPHANAPFEIAPRLGFAWDVTGDGRTALRGGAGAFYDRYPDNDLLELVEISPLVRTYTTNYTTIAELLNSPLTETPNAVRRFPAFVPPVVYNWSVGVQREIGWKAIADVAYVANAARRQAIPVELNGRPYGYAYRPSSLDVTNIQGGQPQPLPDDLLRPYRGYASILQREFTGYADYHSLQLSLNRRRSTDGLTLGAAYTHQIVNKRLAATDPFLPDNRARNYNSAARRPHAFTVHYSYLVPALARSAHPAWRALADNWQISGVTTVLSGAHGEFSYLYSNVPTGTLAGNGSIGGGPNRPRIICDPSLPRSQRTFERQFRTECIAAPDDPFNFGTASGDEFHGPGFVNWDLSAFKSIPLGGSRRLQFRAELYNAFNKSFWTGANTTAEFDYTTRTLTNPTVFGSLSGVTTSARRIQLAARFSF
jgi:hypothetical protein